MKSHKQFVRQTDKSTPNARKYIEKEFELPNAPVAYRPERPEII